MVDRALNLAGQQFGFLTVLQRAGVSGGITKKARWLCRCACGTEVVRESQYLRTKHRLAPRHCGCQHQNITHDMSKSRQYNIWAKMKSRCQRPEDKDWPNYGARGIKVCSAWVDSFAVFWNDMKYGYAASLTLERRDVNKGYNKKNCTWVSSTEQANNTRFNRVLDTPLGRMTVSRAAQEFGLKKVTLFARLNHGWPVEAALLLPTQKRTTSITAAPETGS